MAKNPHWAKTLDERKRVVQPKSEWPFKARLVHDWETGMEPPPEPPSASPPAPERPRQELPADWLNGYQAQLAKTAEAAR